MDADDPRHGTYAGAVAHWRDGESACPDCLAVARRARKSRRLDAHRGNPRRVPLGADAIAVIKSMTRRQLSDATGIRSDKLSTFLRLGPDKVVSRDTRAKILAAGPQPWTPIGIQRRLRGLSWLGWSMRELADRTGHDMDAFKRLRRKPDPKFVRAAFAEAILALYDDLALEVPPNGASATETRSWAIARGYVSPFAWDSIDDPREKPRGLRTAEVMYDGDQIIDQMAVERILHGERVRANLAEKREAMRRWLADGRSENSLCVLMGWKDGRYTPDREDVA